MNADGSNLHLITTQDAGVTSPDRDPARDKRGVGTLGPPGGAPQFPTGGPGDAGPEASTLPADGG